MPTENIFEGVKFLDDVMKSVSNTKDLYDQWRNVADSFVKHKWIYRYIDDKQKAKLEDNYAVLTDDDSSYAAYKKSFKYICRFMGLPDKTIIIENMEFTKDKEDKEQWEIALKYSKGLAKVILPDGISLIHVSPVSGINELIPSFRSKTKGKYMYPSKRVFFTISKDIRPTQAGLEGKKTYRYTPKREIKHVYIDPTYSEFRSGAVYVETETPIPVISIEKKIMSIINKSSKKEETK